MNHSNLTAIGAAMARAALPYLPSEGHAADLANNLALVLADDSARDPEKTAREMIDYRIKAHGLLVGDRLSCARALAETWERASGKSPFVGEAVAAE